MTDEQIREISKATIENIVSALRDISKNRNIGKYPGNLIIAALIQTLEEKANRL